jgi:hypothetical protein
MVGWQQLQLVVVFFNFVPRYYSSRERLENRRMLFVKWDTFRDYKLRDGRKRSSSSSRRVVTKDRQRILFLSGSSIN